MKIVNTGNTFRIFSDDLRTFDTFPVGNYKICFDPEQGFYIEKADNFNSTERSYGDHPRKVEKVMRLFGSVQRSIGVLLSGRKGMGKTMFARLLSENAAKLFNLPTFLVTDAYPGVADFLESIKQECVVIFDEFEKVFDPENRGEKQDKLLTLFDGTSQTKRLYVVTVNDIRKVNSYMINRPGRFHYHMQFNHPSMEEIEMYLKDNMKEEYHNQIPYVQRFSNRVDLNYDMLRAIAFDLNMGYSFIDTIVDLNISASESERIRYKVQIELSNGEIQEVEDRIDLMASSETTRFRLPSDDVGQVRYSPLQITIENKDHFVAEASDVEFQTDWANDNEEIKEGSEIKVVRMTFTLKQEPKQHYGREMTA